MTGPKDKCPPLHTELVELTGWTLDRTADFPKSQRHTFGQRLDNLLRRRHRRRDSGEVCGENGDSEASRLSQSATGADAGDVAARATARLDQLAAVAVLERAHRHGGENGRCVEEVGRKVEAAGRPSASRRFVGGSSRLGGAPWGAETAPGRRFYFFTIDGTTFASAHAGLHSRPVRRVFSPLPSSRGHSGTGAGSTVLGVHLNLDGVAQTEQLPPAPYRAKSPRPNALPPTPTDTTKHCLAAKAVENGRGGTAEITLGGIKTRCCRFDSLDDRCCDTKSGDLSPYCCNTHHDARHGQ